MAAKSKVKPSADLGFSKSPLFGLLTVIFSVCPHSMEEVREFCGVSLRRELISSMRVLRSELSVQLSSVQSLSHVQLFATPWIAARQASLSIETPGVYSNSCPSMWWCYPAISSSVIPFSSCLSPPKGSPPYIITLGDKISFFLFFEEG